MRFRLLARDGLGWAAHRGPRPGYYDISPAAYLRLVGSQCFLLMLVAMPVVLQPELRCWLEPLGRTTGLTRTLRQTVAESILPRLLRTVGNLSATHTGAIIALEGDTVLQKVIDTGNSSLTFASLRHDRKPA